MTTRNNSTELKQGGDFCTRHAALNAVVNLINTKCLMYYYFLFPKFSETETISRLKHSPRYTINWIHASIVSMKQCGRVYCMH